MEPPSRDDELLNVTLEIHTPGLNLHRDRMTKHRLFMGVVHEHVARLGAFAWKQYEKQGRGAVFVNQRQWFEAIRESRWERVGDELLPFAYITEGSAAISVDTDRLESGYESMVRNYDPETTLILLVQHPPGDVLSAYRIEPDPSPKTAYEELAGGAAS